jgi:signal transduction histidine kinase
MDSRQQVTGTRQHSKRLEKLIVPFLQFELVCIGAATVVDTVLLLVLFERRNRAFVALPIALLVFAIWLWHMAAFVRLILADLTGPGVNLAHWTAMMAMATGLMLIPSAMLHGVWRLRMTGLETPTRPGWRYLAIYAPLLLLMPMGLSLNASPDSSFVESLQGWGTFYACWIGLANLVSAYVLSRVKRNVSGPLTESFLTLLSRSLLALAFVQSLILFYLVYALPGWRDPLVLFLAMLPLVPALLFAYFVVRFNLMRLILERTVIYAAILVAIVFVHHVGFEDLRQSLANRYRLDLSLIEGVVIIALVLLYRPLRRRAAEALRYLMGSRIDRTRSRTRQLSLELSSRAGRSPTELLNWFVAEVREALAADYVAGWLFDPAGPLSTRSGSGEPISDCAAATLQDDLLAAGCHVCSRRDAPNRQLFDSLQTCNASLAVAFARDDVAGLVLVGRRSRYRDLGEEEAGAVALLVEQLAVTLASGLLQADRMAAERRALQKEKLSDLGLLASSIAHEVKNPLSSIKTIVTVMSEQLGPASPFSEDLRLILGEVDRLSSTTTQLLQTARQNPTSEPHASVNQILGDTLQMVRHVAKNQGLSLTLNLADNLPRVRADEASLREVFLNLLANSMQALDREGTVSITTYGRNGHVVVCVADDGPGIPLAVKQQLFQPFVTTRPSGTGLGLYVVSRHVRGCGGEIICESQPGRGTCFTIKLPCSHDKTP